MEHLEHLEQGLFISGGEYMYKKYDMDQLVKEIYTVETKHRQLDDDSLLILNRRVLTEDDISVKILDTDEDIKEYTIRYIIINIDFNEYIKVMLIEYLNLGSLDLDVRNEIFNKLYNYIKLTIIRELIIENLALVKNKNIIENELNHYKKYNDIINDIEKLCCNIKFKNELYDLIKEYEIQLKYSITKFDLGYSLFNLIINKKDDDTIISDLEKVRLNKSLRKYKKPRTEYEFKTKFEELKKILKLYFEVESNIDLNEINKDLNKDLNRYLVLRELKGIEMLYLKSYKVKPSIERYRKFISDIDSAYYDFFLKEEIMKYIIEDTDIASLNKLINEIVHISKKKLKKYLYKNTSIYKKIDIINELNTYRLDELELEGIHNILEIIVNEEEIALEEIKKIKNYIIK